MSNQAITWAYSLNLRGAAKPVLVALADYADEAGSCYPGQDKLVHMTGMSLRTVRRALERLERDGLLHRERRFDAYGHRTSDRYYLHIEVQSLPATLTSGHSDLRSESPSLPATVSIPTGHSDRVSLRRTNREPSGGRSTPPPPLRPVDNSEPTATQDLSNGEPAPWCTRHAATEGTDRPCAACGRARDAYTAHAVAASRQAVWQAKQSKAWREGLCREHLANAATCEACAEDRRKGRTA